SPINMDLYSLKDEYNIDYTKDKDTNSNIVLDSFKREPINGSSNSKRVTYDLIEKTIPGQEYTLTYDIDLESRNINNKTTILFGENISDRLNINMNPEERNKYTFTASNEYEKFSIFLGTGYTDDNTNSNGFIKKVKLEKG